MQWAVRNSLKVLLLWDVKTPWICYPQQQKRLQMAIFHGLDSPSSTNGKHDNAQGQNSCNSREMDFLKNNNEANLGQVRLLTFAGTSNSRSWNRSWSDRRNGSDRNHLLKQVANRINLQLCTTAKEIYAPSHGRCKDILACNLWKSNCNVCLLLIALP
jgi:hypothetical protein